MVPGSPRGETCGLSRLAKNSIMIFHILLCYTCSMPRVSFQDEGNNNIQALVENLIVPGSECIFTWSVFCFFFYINFIGVIIIKT